MNAKIVCWYSYYRCCARRIKPPDQDLSDVSLDSILILAKNGVPQNSTELVTIIAKAEPGDIINIRYTSGETRELITK